MRLFRLFGLVSLALVMQVGFSQALPSPTSVLPDLLFVDFVEWNYSEVPGPVPCLDSNGLPGLCLPIVHLFDNAKSLACMAASVDGECLDSVRVVFLPVDISGRALRELQAAERRLIRRIALVVDRAINDPRLPPCHNPITCMPGSPPPTSLFPNPACLLPRVTGAIARALADPNLLPRYYLEVEGIINLWLPNHVRSGTVWPAVDSIVSPTMSGVKDLLGDIQEVIDDIANTQDLNDALSRAYRYQALFSFVSGAQAPMMNFLPSDFEYQNVLGTEMQWPGIYDYELDKYTEDELLLGAALGGLADRLVDALPIPPWASGAVDWLTDQVLDEALGKAFVGDGALRISNPFLYESIGYAGFLQVRSETALRTIWTPNGLNVPMPSVRLVCGLWPFAIRTPMRLWPPVPAVALIPGLAVGSYITVPEGYPVPHTSMLPITPSPLGLMMPR